MKPSPSKTLAVVVPCPACPERFAAAELVPDALNVALSVVELRLSVVANRNAKEHIERDHRVVMPTERDVERYGRG